LRHDASNYPPATLKLESWTSQPKGVAATNNIQCNKLACEVWMPWLFHGVVLIGLARMAFAESEGGSAPLEERGLRTVKRNAETQVVGLAPQTLRSSHVNPWAFRRHGLGKPRAIVAFSVHLVLSGSAFFF